MPTVSPPFPRAAVLLGVLSLLTAAPAGAAPSENEDLAAAIALQGQPCGQVVAAQKRGDNEWIAQCANGKRYRVYTDAQGRARVDIQG